MSELKLVKNAKISYEDNLIIVTHYDVKIGIFDTESKELRYLGGLSPTSNRQIQFMRLAFNPVSEVNLNENFKVYPKNYFSRPL